MPRDDGITIGVEEEFLLVDPHFFTVVPLAPELMAAVAAPLRRFLRHEFLQTQIEIATPVCRSMAELRSHLVRLRWAVQQAALRLGCRIMAAGTGVMPCPEPPPVVDEPRYARIAAHVAGLAAVPGLSACHVHVGVACRNRRIEVLNYLRPYLPTLQALGANSAVAEGRDTGFASWRAVLVGRWPASGPAPLLASAAHFDEVVAGLISAGSILDPEMLYWHARPSPRYPTVEVRACDVCLTVDDTVLIAALSRALVRTALHDPGPFHPDDGLLAGAHWRAARDGAEGRAVDLWTGELVPAWQLADRLLALVTPALRDLGDLRLVQAGLDRLRRSGSGSARQRRVLAEQGNALEVARYLAGQSEVAGPTGGISGHLRHARP